MLSCRIDPRILVQNSREDSLKAYTISTQGSTWAWKLDVINHSHLKEFLIAAQPGMMKGKLQLNQLGCGERSPSSEPAVRTLMKRGAAWLPRVCSYFPPNPHHSSSAIPSRQMWAPRAQQQQHTFALIVFIFFPSFHTFRLIIIVVKYGCRIVGC